MLTADACDAASSWKERLRVYWPRKEVRDTPASNPRSCPHGQIGHSGTPSCPPPTQCAELRRGA